MKTLLSILFIFVLLTAAGALDAYPLDAGALFSAVAAAALFAIALNDPQPERRLELTRVARFPASSRRSAEPRAHSLDLAA
jgi:hypothetical protein